MSYIYQGFRVNIKLGRYYGGNLAVQLEEEDGQPFATASINVKELDLAGGEFVCKDYSENEGMLNFLLSNGIAEDTGRKVNTGYVNSSILKLITQ